jgi:hypothetical protein
MSSGLKKLRLKKKGQISTQLLHIYRKIQAAALLPRHKKRTSPHEGPLNPGQWVKHSDRGNDTAFKIT